MDGSNRTHNNNSDYIFQVPFVIYNNYSLTFISNFINISYTNFIKKMAKLNFDYINEDTLLSVRNA